MKSTIAIFGWMGVLAVPLLQGQSVISSRSLQVQANNSSIENPNYIASVILIDGFTKTYKCHRLVFFESFDEVAKAIDREKQLKRWSRVKKDWLISLKNPTWEDLEGQRYKRPQFTSEKTAGPTTRQLIGKA